MPVPLNCFAWMQSRYKVLLNQLAGSVGSLREVDHLCENCCSFLEVYFWSMPSIAYRLVGVRSQPGGSLSLLPGAHLSLAVLSRVRALAMLLAVQPLTLVLTSIRPVK